MLGAYSGLCSVITWQYLEHQIWCWGLNQGLPVVQSKHHLVLCTTFLALFFLFFVFFPLCTSWFWWLTGFKMQGVFFSQGLMIYSESGRHYNHHKDFHSLSVGWVLCYLESQLELNLCWNFRMPFPCSWTFTFHCRALEMRASSAVESLSGKSSREPWALNLES